MGEQTTKVYGVTELTRRIKALLERSVGTVWIEGETSNVRQPGSGHYYFTLKDETAQISAVLFKGSQRGMGFALKDGLRVRVQGEISVYERSGTYQVIVRAIEEAGKGALLAKFEALKEKLRAEGLFDTARKRPIPLLPRHVGVVTSPTGAAIRDILNVVSRRFPNLHLALVPARVQGEGAAAEIVAGIELLNRIGGFDVLIVGRGGGSLEDLWCFNEEIVARAIAASDVPVISAVGHEIDFTISDFVADLRAPTPSAAAELVVGRKDEFERRLDGLSGRLVRTLRERVLGARNRLLGLAGKAVFGEPSHVVRGYRQRLETAGLRMRHDLAGTVGRDRQRLDELGMRLEHLARSRLQVLGAEVNRKAAQVAALSPLAVLKRGYSVTTDDRGVVLRDAAAVRTGQRIHTRVMSGEVTSIVTDGRSGGRSRRPATRAGGGEEQLELYDNKKGYDVREGA